MAGVRCVGAVWRWPLPACGARWASAEGAERTQPARGWPPIFYLAPVYCGVRLPMDTQPPAGPRVVIIGAGFGGLEAAKHLGDKPVHVTVIDRTIHHLFQPLLYQVASAALSPADISLPIRGILSDYANVAVVLAEVQSVDVVQRTVNCGERRIG